MSAQVAYRVAGLPAGGAGMSGPMGMPQGRIGTGIYQAGARPPRSGSATTPGYKAGITGAFQQFKNGLPAAPAAPAAAAVPGGQPAQQDPEVRDTSYFAGVAQNIANRTTGLAGLAKADTRLNEDNQTAQQQLTRNYALQQRDIGIGANKQGLTFSGELGRRLGVAEQGNRSQSDALARNLTRGHEDVQLQREGLTRQYGDPNDANDHGVGGMGLLADATQRYQYTHPVPTSVYGRPGENGLPQGFNSGGWQGLNPGYTVEWDPMTGKAKRIVKQ